MPGRADAVDDLAERPQRDGGLAERRQHPLDVAHEDAARADDEHAAGLVAAAVGVEEVRRAVQRDDRLAGARPAGDRRRRPCDGARIARSCSAWMVATIECIDRSRARESCAISAPSPTIGRSVPASASSSSSSTPTTVGPGAAQHPAPDDVLRVGGGGLVEHRGRGRPPVDQQRVVVVVAQADPADVARVGVELGAQVEAAEDQPLVGGVELGDPLRGLEDHGVALDETALVAEPPALVALPGQLLGGRRRLLQLRRTPGRRTPALPRSPASAALPTNPTPHPKLPPKTSRPVASGGRQTLNTSGRGRADV